MDWNLRAPSWGFAEFAQETLPNINEVGGGSSSFGGSSEAKGDFSVDLKLGQVSNPVNEHAAGNLVSKKASPPLGSTKRPRGANDGAQVVSCLVDGCYADLASCREYHRRHKVCELHSKTPEVTIGGLKQRFCQQCSRFHSLEEFDEGKRSCRKRLEGHNRRRRKPQPDPLIRPVNCLSNYQGARFSAFSNPYPSAALEGNSAWARMDNRSNAEGLLYNQHHQQMPLHLGMHSLIPGPSSGIYGDGGVKQFPLLQGHQTALQSSSFSQPLHSRAISMSSESGGGNSGNNDMFYDGILTLQVQDSDCALSLLSSPQMQTTGLGTMRPLIPPPRLLGGGNHTQDLVTVDSVLVSSHGSEANIGCHGGMFHMGSDGPPGHEASQTLPFHWD
ncbi:hypothetical protein SAY86_009494 [Trapa natans]|uniref:SBP-type domain-containing protein n=1 Tax=Trapa natans TaxID=22666 RepID=A0AAN7QPU3_TRANT|nr:hypothetical protein SAY86_009494 [Trapa natans]